MLVSVIVGLLVEGVCFKAVRSDNPLTSMVSAFAMWMVLEEIIILATWGRLFPVENPTGLATFDIGGFMVRGDYFILFVSAVLLMGLVYWLLYRTAYGRAVRAIATNRKAAQLMGIDVARMSSTVFVLTSAFGGLVAFFIAASLHQITPGFGLWATVKGLIVMILGGIGSIPGAILGGAPAGSDRASGAVVPGRRLSRPRRVPRAVHLPGRASERDSGRRRGPRLGRIRKPAAPWSSPCRLAPHFTDIGPWSARAGSRYGRQGERVEAMSDYMISVLSLICIESFVALSTYLLLITGQISFGQQAYFGIGAFTGGAMTAMWGFDLSTALLAGGLVAGGAAAVVGALTFRLGGLYFAIATLSFAELMRLTWVNLIYQIEMDGFMVGPKGAEGFRDIRYVIDNAISPAEYLAIIASCLVAILVFFFVLERSRFGLALRMIDNDETAAASVGLSPTRHKIAAAALAGAIAGIGGVLFAHYMTFIDPRNFGVMLGVHSLAYGMIGGLGTFFGPLIGVVIDIGLLESLRVFSGYRMIVFGSLVVLILIFRPRGILDEKTVHRISTSVRGRFGRGRPGAHGGFG